MSPIVKSYNSHLKLYNSAGKASNERIYSFDAFLLANLGKLDVQPPGWTTMHVAWILCPGETSIQSPEDLSPMS
jgi:hypothetical protein